MTGLHPRIINSGVLPRPVCRQTVTRAYYGMIDSGAPAENALGVAVKVYCYHNPADTIAAARAEVERWLGVRILQ